MESKVRHVPVCLGFLERKIPIGKRPVSLTGITLTGVPARSHSGDENMTPPDYPSPPTPPSASEAVHTVSSTAGQELSPARKAGNLPPLPLSHLPSR